MKIDKGHTTPYAHNAAVSRREPPPGATDSPSTPNDAVSSDRRRSDRVEFSADARALAEQPPITAERLAEIQAKIRSGHYNSSAVADAVARKLVGRLGG
jgi:anti-sigma28 factor (negative regulator of flagellin synthesis)